MTPSLPQDSADPDARRRALAAKRDDYDYLPDAENPLAPIAVAGKYPYFGGNGYDLSWALPYVPQFLKSFFDTQTKKIWYGLRGKIGGFDKMVAFRRMFSRFWGLPAPDTIQNWQSDAHFARKWLDGPNPVLLERARDPGWLHHRIPLAAADFQSALPGPTLDAEIAAGNVFVLDYDLLEKSLLPPSTVHRDTRWRDKYLPAPVVVFCQRPGVDPFCQLVPVAIQIDQKDARPPNPIYLRGSGHGWELAKLFVDVADFNHQAMSSHIYRHHYLAEPFVLATKRQLSEDHPLHILLEPHLAYTLAVNKAAFDLMKVPGKIFDEIYAGEIQETRQIMIESYKRWTVRQEAFTYDLHARGVETGPAEYPYRDDALLWIPALERYAGDYVRLFYASDAAVRDDYELQAWIAELTSPTEGRLRGLLAGPSLDTVAELAEILALFFFACGPGHAAVHYPQTDYFTFVPMMPGAAYRPPPEIGEPITPERILDTLPPFSQGADQFNNNEIAYFRLDKFGTYDSYRKYALATLPQAQPVIARLQSDLAAVELEIRNRNQHRARPYIYMLPSLVPNSINV